MKKQCYIDVLEKIMAAYSDEEIKAYTEEVQKRSIWEHGYPRLTANLGMLIANGKKADYKEEFCKMMDICCEEIPVALGKNDIAVGNEFSVKEIVMCILELEKKSLFDKWVTDKWRENLSKINPHETYSVIASKLIEEGKHVNNWAAFGGASEVLRKYAGIGDESQFIEEQIKSQMVSFDENGMYRDPHEPMVYDFVTRLQLALALHYGYDGECREELEENFLKSAELTLKMQSVTGEIPYGGRSGQFLHNETSYAALCEFYASFFKKRGDIEMAGKFKSAARLAVESVIPWLCEEKISHIKNYYDPHENFGCEAYAYFDKYMITAGSWTYMAYLLADDSIDDVLCPAIAENFICETSEHFHKMMCKFGDYFVEFDTNADTDYDANGLGRVHKKGAPSAICLSVPFAENPHYKISEKNPSLFSICTGVKNVYTYSPSAEYNLIEKTVTDGFVRIKFECKIEDVTINQTFTVSDDGVEFVAEGDGEVEILFPVFDFDGKIYTEKHISEKEIDIFYKGYKCAYLSDGIIENKNLKYENRNGCYNAFGVREKNKVSLKIEITEI